MTEEDPVFDPTLKKKKKKKKPINLEDTEQASESQGHVEDEGVKEITEKVDDLDFNSLKKKKKKVYFDPESQKTEEGDNEGLDDNFSFDKKKKKKKVRGTDLDQVDSMAPKGKENGTTLLIDSDREYTYEELLQRVFDIMREKNPDMVAGEKRKFVMKPPQVMRVGTKKSSFANFHEICKMLHRTPKHLMAFLLAELGTSGAIDGNNQLIIKGRFQQKQIESVLRRYIKEYVTCHTCKSPETILSKDTRLYFLQCESCGSRCSVASIKSGFQAVTGKRAAIRAKTN
ncbi:DgyrCDS710 [Dimorphilus gyrociliatus]|uniref:Eukaryotic translation initiation factor 2 subunit 2 n=1 Tax=Dimorphilus gyrociliatus TaxID=2664684 RepID=A0A7I8V583_9ANNE|nr:DgyrCDS710 [Dimorphilus gyrociliatus]